MGKEREAKPTQAPKKETHSFAKQNVSSSAAMEYILHLQRTVGNRAVQGAIGNRAVQVGINTDICRGESVAPLAISRQVRTPQAPPQPQNLGPVRPAPEGGMSESVTFEPTFEIVPGGLGAGKQRTQQLVFRGDTLIFRAHAQNISAANFAMEGRVSGDSAATGVISGDVVTWRVVVGKMGTPGKPGEPAELVDAKPTIELVPPVSNAGQKFQQTYQFRVVADMSWLSGQCLSAGLNLQLAFLHVASLLEQAFLNYDEAYQAHKEAVNDHGKRQQLQNDILLGILLAGIGGAVGGELADTLKSNPYETGAAISTATGDIAKYIIRLSGVHGPSSTGKHGTDTPGPSASAGTPAAAGVIPARWKALKEKELKDAGEAGLNKCKELKDKMDEAWAQGRTEMMDLDPVQIVEPTVQALQSKVEVKTPTQYAIELWRTWLRTYGITAKENWAGGKTRTDATAGRFAFTDSKLFDDIHKQVGTALDDEVARLRYETAPDPLTELPD
jgi:hypothetical protein